MGWSDVWWVSTKARRHVVGQRNVNEWLCKTGKSAFSSKCKKVYVNFDLYGAITWNGDTSNIALMSLMSGREMRFQVPPKTFRLDGWITQQIRQWVPNCQTSDWESPGAKCAATNRGIFSLRRLAERRCCEPETSETGAQQSARYRHHYANVRQRPYVSLDVVSRDTNTTLRAEAHLSY